MKRFAILSLLCCSLVVSTLHAKSTYTQLDNATDSTQSIIVQASDIARYKLYPTQNMWNFIKLDTQTGQMWQVQYSMKGNERFECVLSQEYLISLVYDKPVNGRFALYPTQNTYNFILLDQIDGRTWQVQWSFERKNRLLLRIY